MSFKPPRKIAAPTLKRAKALATLEQFQTQPETPNEEKAVDNATSELMDDEEGEDLEAPSDDDEEEEDELSDGEEAVLQAALSEYRHKKAIQVGGQEPASSSSSVRPEKEPDSKSSGESLSAEGAVQQPASKAPSSAAVFRDRHTGEWFCNCCLQRFPAGGRVRSSVRPGRDISDGMASLVKPLQSLRRPFGQGVGSVQHP